MGGVAGERVGGDVRRVSAVGGEAAEAEQHDRRTEGRQGRLGSALPMPALTLPGGAGIRIGIRIGIGAAAR